MNNEKYLPGDTNSKLPPVGGIEGGSIQEETNLTSPLEEGLGEALNTRFSGKSPEEVLAYFLAEYKGRIALSSSLSIED
jgi:hypothetical protein